MRSSTPLSRPWGERAWGRESSRSSFSTVPSRPTRPVRRLARFEFSRRELTGLVAGLFVDNNVAEDPLRASRYYYSCARVLLALGTFAEAHAFKPRFYLETARRQGLALVDRRVGEKDGQGRVFSMRAF